QISLSILGEPFRTAILRTEVVLVITFEICPKRFRNLYVIIMSDVIRMDFRIYIRAANIAKGSPHSYDLRISSVMDLSEGLASLTYDFACSSNSRKAFTVSFAAFVVSRNSR